MPAARYFDEARAYSPSRPVASSSETEQDNQLINDADAVSFSSGGDSGQQTFIPQPEVNTFQITSEEMNNVHSLRNTFKGTILSMAAGSSFAFVGACCVTILRGAISLMGVRLHASLCSYPVFSPKSNPLALVKALDDMPAESIITLPSRIVNKTGDTSIIVLLQPVKTGIESLGRYRILSQLFHVDDGQQNRLINKVIGVEGLYFVDPSAPPKPQMQPFVLFDSWSNALDSSISNAASVDGFSIPEPFVGLVRGPKNCGKSTFARTLLNTLLTRYIRVAFLECDIGQSEFMPGGMVSLHVISTPIFGPPFTHPTIPFRAHYIGSSTPRSIPSYYITAIQSLIETYRSEIRNLYEEAVDGDTRFGSIVPLVINTQGWIKGLGADLLQRIEDLAAPTAIFDMDPEGLCLSHPQQSNHVYHIQPILSPALTQYFTATDHRTFATLSYFHASFTDGESNGRATRWNTELPLCAYRPWEISLKKGVDKIILAGAGAEDVIPEELHYAINCALVGLVCDDHAVTGTNPPYYIRGGELPSPSGSQCVGLALIRGVDLQKGRLHLLSPLPPKVLRSCRTLVKGELEMPVWGMIDFQDAYNNGVAGVGWGKVPYLQMGHGDVGINVIGAARRRVRRNLMRKNQVPP